MTIAQRNFFRLLRAGAYGNQEQIEPMSAWKWRQTLKWAQKLGLSPLLYDGVKTCEGQFFMRLTDDVWQQLQEDTQQAEQSYHQTASEVAELLTLLGERQLRPILLEPWTSGSLYSEPRHHRLGIVNIFFPFATQGNKADEWAKENGTNVDTSRKNMLRYQWKSLRVEHRHRMLVLNNKLNNHTLQGIIEQERLEGGTTHVIVAGQRIETIAPTLDMLITLLGIVKATLRDGIQLWQVADLGQQLRQQGDRVDFVKLQGWIERLHFTRMAQLVGNMLTGLLGFSVDEVPFMQPSSSDGDIDNIVESLFTDSARRPAKYLRYCPGESISSVVASITHSLGNIEE